MSAVRAVRIALSTALLALLALFGTAAPGTAAPGTAAPGTAAGGGVIRGGDGLYSGGGGRCAVAFNATDGKDFYGLMAGFCGGTGTQWFADAQRQVPVGETVLSHFPGGNFSVIHYTNPDLTYPSEVNSYTGPPIRVERAVEPLPGMAICRSGPTTGWHCGTIQQVNVSVQFPEGLVTGLFRANVCAEPGDGGGPAVSGDAAVGILVSASGDCSSGGTSYYQPVVGPLAAAGLTVGY